MEKANKRNSIGEINEMRNHMVVKSNELIQQRTHMLTIQEQKALLFLISQIQPEQEEFEYQVFDIVDFCEVCGIDANQGKNYEDLRKAIKSLRDKSMWVIGDKSDVLMGWISNAKIEKNKGTIKVKFDDEMKPYLLQLKSKYTQYELIYTLGMKSKYSIRLYEILKSYQKINEPIQFKLERFKELVGSNYDRWVDVRRFIIEPAIKEINKLTDLFVEYTALKKGRAVAYIDFDITTKTGTYEELATRQQISKIIDKTEPAVKFESQYNIDE